MKWWKISGLRVTWPLLIGEGDRALPAFARKVYLFVTVLGRDCKLSAPQTTWNVALYRLPIASSTSSNFAWSNTLLAAWISILKAVLSSPSISVNATHAAQTEGLVKCCTATLYALTPACCMLSKWSKCNKLLKTSREIVMVRQQLHWSRKLSFVRAGTTD